MRQRKKEKEEGGGGGNEGGNAQQSSQPLESETVTGPWKCGKIEGEKRRGEAEKMGIVKVRLREKESLGE